LDTVIQPRFRIVNSALSARGGITETVTAEFVSAL
jgi:hypothetical protein